MYGAKQAGRNGYLFFDAEHDKPRRGSLRRASGACRRRSTRTNSAVLPTQGRHAQRQGAGRRGAAALEAPGTGRDLAGAVPAADREHGLSISVGNWVLQHGIDQLAHWLRMGLDITVSINVSARHLQEPLFAQHLAGLLSRHQARSLHTLIIEVLETAALADVDYTCALMEECRSARRALRARRLRHRLLHLHRT
jgi:predicted signal transduction protein with EAL and GGDEF domain